MSSPIVLVFRLHTGCRQYPFSTLEDFRKWANRKPYANEDVRVLPIVDGKIRDDIGFSCAAPAAVDRLATLLAAEVTS